MDFQLTFSNLFLYRTVSRSPPRSAKRKSTFTHIITQNTRFLVNTKFNSIRKQNHEHEGYGLVCITRLIICFLTIYRGTVGEHEVATSLVANTQDSLYKPHWMIWRVSINIILSLSLPKLVWEVWILIYIRLLCNEKCIKFNR